MDQNFIMINFEESEEMPWLDGVKDNDIINVYIDAVPIKWERRAADKNLCHLQRNKKRDQDDGKDKWKT